MLVTPLPGVDRRHLLETLSAVHTDVSNQYTGGPLGFDKRLLAYLDWTSSAVERLGSLISAADLDRLVLTKRHEMLLSGVGTLANNRDLERLTNTLVSLELRQRTAAFEDAVKSLGQELALWERRGRPVVADSSFYIKHPDKLEEANFPELLNLWDDSVHLIVPMVVVDELDHLKEHRDPHVRWRAGYTLAVFDRLFQGGTAHAVLHGPDVERLRTTGIEAGGVTVELLLDPPGHMRLPINDDEIVDRAQRVKPLAGRQVSVLTYDTGQATRARMVGLQDVKLRKPLGEEPKQEAGSRANKRVADAAL